MRRRYTQVPACVLTVALSAAFIVGTATAQIIPQVSSALPLDGDLTLADGAGNVLIGLTIRPAQPGLNDVLLYVLPIEGLEERCRAAPMASVSDHPLDAALAQRPVTRTEVDAVAAQGPTASRGARCARASQR